LTRRLPVGAELISKDRAHFRVWAPKRRKVEVVFDAAAGSTPLPDIPLERSADGYHEGEGAAAAGARYRFRLDDGDAFPDPASRFQPDGPHGPSQLVDPTAFPWTDNGWQGVPAAKVVAYEMHVGTFTREGTWRAAAADLPRLAKLGVTIIEMMPVADFVGQFGWGYDGVNLFAPTHLYGEPDDLRAFIDRAHALGIGVIMDVVYNHFGPSGAYFNQFADEYFSEHETEWGRALNFDGRDAAAVREFFVSNAGYWIDEFHCDGLRLDATQSISDKSPRHVVADVAAIVRQKAGSRATWIVAENERQAAYMARDPARGGLGLDALWNDDYHHSAVVALTGHREAYYCDYQGRPQEFVSAAKHGFLYQGQWYRWQANRRGHASLDLPTRAFVAFLENHDQVANSAAGIRLYQQCSPGKYRAMLALTLLGPWTPMLFQGQEFASTAPFLFFADHEPPLADAVRKGRAEFLRQFPRLALPGLQRRLADPCDVATFDRCKLDDEERAAENAAWMLHHDLLALRRSDPTLQAQGAHGVDGAVLSSESFVLRIFGEPGTHADRLLVVNLGADLVLPILPEPLLAPPEGHEWELRWSSEGLEYGGLGIHHVEARPGWELPSESAVLLAAVPSSSTVDPWA